MKKFIRFILLMIILFGGIAIVAMHTDITLDVSSFVNQFLNK